MVSGMNSIRRRAISSSIVFHIIHHNSITPHSTTTTITILTMCIRNRPMRRVVTMVVMGVCRQELFMVFPMGIMVGITGHSQSSDRFIGNPP